MRFMRGTRDTMEYQGTVIRPPSEADSILLQVTLGCPHNRCAFCGAYADKPFAVRDEASLERDLDFAARHCRGLTRVFLCDGDSMAMPLPRLERLLERIRERLPWVRRVASYASAGALAGKSDADLARLRSLGLGMVYMGLESGDDAVLARMNKHGDAASHVRQGRRAHQAGMRLDVTVILGLAGPEGSMDHALGTGRALTDMDPNHASALTLMLVPGTPLHADWEAGRFVLPGPMDMLAELRAMLEATHLSRGLFLANHASNYLPLKVRLPRGKAEALARIDAALAGNASLRPEWRRGL